MVFFGGIAWVGASVLMLNTANQALIILMALTSNLIGLMITTFSLLHLRPSLYSRGKIDSIRPNEVATINAAL